MGDWSIVALAGILCVTWIVWWGMFLAFKDNQVVRPPVEKPAQEEQRADTMVHPSEADTGIWPKTDQL